MSKKITDEQRIRYNKKQKVRQAIYRKNKKMDYVITMFNYWKKELEKLKVLEEENNGI